MLTTDGYAFLNINHPVCAWATYRSFLVSTEVISKQGSFVSVWLASLLSRDNPGPISVEFEIEKVRRALFPDSVSRLTGLYCFLSLEDAEKAANLWGTNGQNHFRAKYLAELYLGETTGRDRLDSNWITYAPHDENGFLTTTHWIADYWRGKPSPQKDPIWETLVRGKIVVLGTELPKRAYEIIRKRFPDSLTLLENARLGAQVGSDIGNLSGFLLKDGDEIRLTYLMDMRDAKNPVFLEKLGELMKSGHPVNWADIRPNFEKGTFGRTPDLRPFEFRWPKGVFAKHLTDLMP